MYPTNEAGTRNSITDGREVAGTRAAHEEAGRLAVLSVHAPDTHMLLAVLCVRWTHTRWPTLPLMQVRRAVGWLLAVDAHRIDGPGEMLITRKLTQRLPDSLTYASSEHLWRCLEDVSMLTLAETDALRQEVRGLFFLFDALQTKLLGDPNLPWATKTRVQQRVHERIMRAEELFESERPEMQGQRSSLRLRP